MIVRYIRPLVQTGPARTPSALPLAGGTCWFDTVEILSRAAPSRFAPAAELPPAALARLTEPRPALAGLDFSQPQIMGTLNVTPDSFSDGGRHAGLEEARAAARAMAAAGAAVLDIGGESTRPGAAEVPIEEEIARTAPVLTALRADMDLPLSIDTRKAAVAQEAVAAGANLINDVSGLTFDPDLAPFCINTGLPVCIMHSQGNPDVMQIAPRYDDVLLDVYDALEDRLALLEAQGLPRARVLVDPGIGFGKTQAHNLTLLRNISLFHGLGCPILLGVSRKGFIGAIGAAPAPQDRAPGSIAVGLAALTQGVQLLRVHDVAETAQALRLWSALHNAR